MTISSIHFKRVDPFFCEKHNSRETEKQPTYLLDKNLRKSNDFERLLPDDLDITGLHIKQLAIRRNNKCRGKAPDIEDSCWEAVINLEARHTLKDLQPVLELLQEKYHLTPTSVAIHRDEGYYDELSGTAKYNYHAHIPCYTVSEGKSVMRTIGRKQLSDMQTEVAQLLGMQRGQENSKATRLDHKQYREKAKAIAEVEQKHNQELAEVKQKQKQAEAVLEQVQPVLQRSAEEKKQLHGTVKQLTNKVFTLKAQKAIVEAERKRWKEAHDFVAGEYRKLQALNKTLYTEEQLNAELQKLRDAHALRLKAVKATQKAKLKIQKAKLKNALDDNTVLQNKLDTKPKEVIKTVEKIVEKPIQVKVPRQLTASEIEELTRVQELKKQNTELTQQRDNLIKFNSTVLQVIQAMYSDFDLEHPIQSLKKIYSAWKNSTQKSQTTAPKLSQSDETTPERVEVQQDVQQPLQSQPMSVLEHSEVKQYELIINGESYKMTAEEMKEAIKGEEVFSRKQIESALTDEQRAEVFGEPTQTTSSLRSKGFHR